MRRAVLATLLTFATLTALAIPGAARADETRDVAEPVAPPTPEPVVRRPWLYVDDPSVAAPLTPVVSSGLTMSLSGTPSRPFASNVAAGGATYEVSGEVGVAPRFSLQATALSLSEQPASGLGIGALAGARVALVDERATHLTLSGGYLREVGAGNGAWMRLSFAQDVGRARLAVTGHGEHVFAAGRDGVDVMVLAGASYQVAGPARVGIEYVAQDLEGAVEAEAEGGVRHFVGPNAGLELDHRRLQITAGPAVGLSYGSPKALGRLAVAYSF